MQENCESKQQPTNITACDEAESTMAKKKYTNEEIIKSYKNIIALSMSNKISCKNAFDLNLIDFMAELLRINKNKGFEEAGVTLDVGGKIYAQRVEALLTDARKILGVLNLSNKSQDPTGKTEEKTVKESAKTSRKCLARVENEAKITSAAMAGCSIDLDIISMKLIIENTTDSDFNFLCYNDKLYESDMFYLSNEKSPLLNRSVNISNERQTCIPFSYDVCSVPMSAKTRAVESDNCSIDTDSETCVISMTDDNNEVEDNLDCKILPDALSDITTSSYDEVLVESNSCTSCVNDVKTENCHDANDELKENVENKNSTMNVAESVYRVPANYDPSIIPAFWGWKASAPRQTPATIKKQKRKRVERSSKRSIDFSQPPKPELFKKKRKKAHLLNANALKPQLPLYVDLPSPDYFTLLSFFYMPYRPVLRDWANIEDEDADNVRLVHEPSSEDEDFVFEDITCEMASNLNAIKSETLEAEHKDISLEVCTPIRFNEHSDVNKNVQINETVTPSVVDNSVYITSQSLIDIPMTVKKLTMNNPKRCKKINMKVMQSYVKTLLEESPDEKLPVTHKNFEDSSIQNVDKGKSLRDVYLMALNKAEIKVELSPAIIFAAILHLANDFGFSLIDTIEMNDVYVMYEN